VDRPEHAPLPRVEAARSHVDVLVSTLGSSPLRHCPHHRRSEKPSSNPLALPLRRHPQIPQPGEVRTTLRIATPDEPHTVTASPIRFAPE
jgi:hypothetical protein